MEKKKNGPLHYCSERQLQVSAAFIIFETSKDDEKNRCTQNST